MATLIYLLTGRTPQASNIINGRAIHSMRDIHCIGITMILIESEFFDHFEIEGGAIRVSSILIGVGKRVLFAIPSKISYNNTLN